jgi:hypothetical protein
MDPSRGATDDQEVSYEEFFHRPVQIGSYSWNVGASLDINIKPWTLWMDNPRVSNRLNNFQNFRGRLHLKVVINGNQFYWGKAMATYLPYTASSFYKTESTFASQIPASQRPHFYIDPTSSQGGEMVLPFFYPNDCFNLVSDSPNVLGEFWITSLVGLQHANGSSQPIDITIFAWASDVVLSAPTNVNRTSLTPQSGKDETEESGPVSKTASIVANVAGSLSKAPVIGQYALATQMAAGGLATAARAFGFSRPKMIDPPETRRIWQTGDLATTDQKDTCMPLSLTAKQEVTVDPRTVGLNSEDELDFKHLCKTQSYLTKFNWSLTASNRDPLFSVRVNPMMYNISSHVFPASSPSYNLTPTAFCAQPFSYWRGSMTYRFQIAASAFHKGRLLVVWDPMNSTTNPEMNTVYNKILDISEDRDFTITVGWGSNLAGLLVEKSIIEGADVPFKISSTETKRTSYDNGILTVYVLNNLVTSGTSTDPVQVIVSTCSDDMEFWGPNADVVPRTTYTPQSGELEESPDDAPDDSPTNEDVGGDHEDSIFRVLAGDRISSFRPLLKRYQLLRVISGYENGGVSGDFYRVYWNTKLDGRIQITAGDVRPTPLLDYCRYAFSGQRGSYRYKFLPYYFSRDAGVIGTRSEYATSDITKQIAPSGNDALITQKMWQFSLAGEVVSNSAAGKIVEMEMPYYSWWRFDPVVNNNDRNLEYAATATMEVLTDARPNDPFSFAAGEYISVGEDYNVFYFLGVPPMWRILLP